MDCIFCKIVNKEIPAREAWRDEHVVAFHDLNPQAPVHVLLIPTRHIEHLQAAEGEDAKILCHLLTVVPQLAAKLGLEESGFRLVNNCKELAGQTVWHIHFHLLGGRGFGWPPG